MFLSSSLPKIGLALVVLCFAAGLSGTASAADGGSGTTPPATTPPPSSPADDGHPWHG